MSDTNVVQPKFNIGQEVWLAIPSLGRVNSYKIRAIRIHEEYTAYDLDLGHGILKPESVLWSTKDEAIDSAIAAMTLDIEALEAMREQE